MGAPPVAYDEIVKEEVVRALSRMLKRVPAAQREATAKKLDEGLIASALQAEQPPSPSSTTGL
jgi:hypothetical protein